MGDYYYCYTCTSCDDGDEQACCWFVVGVHRVERVGHQKRERASACALANGLHFGGMYIELRYDRAPRPDMRAASAVSLARGRVKRTQSALVTPCP
jgi:hypothetical protein